mmetsp:Transcript_60353/g.99595  ORF Transcript_60353/g.99595 Transcript_60353/m.99595 type:complete len:209 (+) Transcript_60353:165-791(+)
MKQTVQQKEDCLNKQRTSNACWLALLIYIHRTIFLLILRLISRIVVSFHFIDKRLQLLIVQVLHIAILAHHNHRRIVRCQCQVTRAHRFFQRIHTVLYQLVLTNVCKRVILFLQIGFSRLISGANRVRKIFKIIASGISLVQMGAISVVANHQQSHAKRTTLRRLCLSLTFVRHIEHHSRHWHRRIVHVSIIQCLRSHIFAQATTIRG